MIHSVKIKGYRTFADFALNGLGRINLIVGKNNTGKSSLLEVIALLSAGSDLSVLWQTLSRRGEQAINEGTPGRAVQQEVDVGHLFTGHAIHTSSEISLVATNQSPPKSLKLRIAEAKPEENPTLFNMLNAQDPAGAGMSLKLSSAGGATIPPIPLTRRGTLRADVFNQAWAMIRAQKIPSETVQYVTTESLNYIQLQQLWNDVALTKEEELVVQAIQFIDPTIERVAPVVGQYIGGIYGGYATRGGFFIRRKEEERVPIGSLGDGIWRLFALATALSRAKGGVLLVDEIDTGLHYSVMAEMWKFLNRVSKEFGVQVFATSHSYDCIHSLAWICSEEDSAHEITVQHIESGAKESTPYTESEIKLSARRHIEMR